MIVYTVISVVLSGAMIYLTYRAMKTKKYLLHAKISVLTAAAGLVLLLAGLILPGRVISSLEGELQYWSQDLMSCFRVLTLPAFAVINGISLIGTALFRINPKMSSGFMSYVRIICGALAPVPFFLITGYVAELSVNRLVNLSIYIMTAGIGEALLSRITTAAELAVMAHFQKTKVTEE